MSGGDDNWRKKSEASPLKGSRGRGRGRGRGGDRGSSNANARTIVPEAWNEAAKISQSNERQIGQILDSLNSLHYPIEGLREEMCLDVILHLCENNACKQDLIASKVCQLVTTLCAKQQIVPDKYLGKICSFLIEIISNSHSWLLVDSLRALSYALSQSNISILSTDQFKAILENVMPHSSLTISDLEVRRQTINVLASICHSSPPEKKFMKFFPAIYASCYRNFDQWSKFILEDAGLSKHLKNVLRALANVITSGDKVHVQHIEDLTARLSILMFYGTKAVPISNKCLSKKKQDHDNIVTSDSDISDNELTGPSREALHIRIQSLQVLTAMAHRDFKTLFGQWNILFPTDPIDTLSLKSKFITTVMLFDISSRCRGVAAACISAMLEKSKMFLAQADDEQTKSAFMPFSHKLAAMLHQIHIALLYAAENERHTPALCQIIKCLTTLIENMPYAKLLTLKGNLTRLLHLLRTNMSSHDRSVAVTSLQCLAAIFGNQQCIEEIGETVTEWIPIMLESNDGGIVITSMAKNYIDVIIEHWDKVKVVVKSGLSHYDATSRMIAIQTLVNLTSLPHQQSEEESLPEHNTTQPTQAQQTLNKRLSDMIGKYRTREISVDLWYWILKEALRVGQRGCLFDVFHGVRISACSILGNIPSAVMESFQSEYRSILIEELLSIARTDQLVSVRAQAYRSLGQLALKIDMPNITTATLRTIIKEETNINVRIKIAWLIANYCEHTDQSHCNEMRELLLMMVSEKKLTSSAVRALGTMTSDIIPQLIPFIQDEDVKVRWNACFAVGRLGVGPAIEALCGAIYSDENFKVRIQAAAALALTKDYGSNLAQVLQALVRAFSHPQSLSNFKEYRYLKTLKDQLQNTLFHVIDSMNSIDGAAQVMIENVHIVSAILQGALNQQTSNEKASEITHTIEHAAFLYQSVLDGDINLSEEECDKVSKAVEQMKHAAEQEGVVYSHLNLIKQIK